MEYASPFPGNELFNNFYKDIVMIKNVGNADSFIRFLVGLSLLLNIIILQPGFWGLLVLLVLGLLMLRSAFTRYCPVYVPFKIFTCTEKSCDCDCCCTGNK